MDAMSKRGGHLVEIPIVLQMWVDTDTKEEALAAAREIGHAIALAPTIWSSKSGWGPHAGEDIDIPKQVCVIAISRGAVPAEDEDIEIEELDDEDDEPAVG